MYINFILVIRHPGNGHESDCNMLVKYYNIIEHTY